MIDACANNDNKKYELYFRDASKEWLTQRPLGAEREFCLKGLETSDDYSIFMNPPYSNPEPFLKRAWEFSEYMTVVCLVPNSIMTCKYLDFLFESGMYRKSKDGLEIRFLSRRTRFNHPTKKMTSPPGGCMVLGMDRRNVQI